MPWNFLTKSKKKNCAFLICHHELQWGRMILYSMVKHLNAMIIIGVEENDDNKALIYVKGFQKCE